MNYKKYSLENLENWMHDAMSASGATPQEIYDVIKSVVEDNYYTYEVQTEKAYELLALLNGNGKGHLSCDKDDPSPKCKGAWNDFWEKHQQYTDEELNEMCDAAEKSDKVNKWILPVEPDPSGEYFVTFPDDLLEAADLKEGDEVEWIDNKNGTYTAKKIEKIIRTDEC